MEELASGAVVDDGTDLNSETQLRLAQRIMFIVELALLGLFLVDFSIHAIGYGSLFIKHVNTIAEALLILINIAILLIMETAIAGVDRN